jgi:RNA polymerase sigma-70 factor, ECF subfamily
MIGPEARGAWKELERQLRPYLARRVASAADIDDLMQDVFVRLHRGLATLRDDERFGAWVYRIARSAIVDHARQRSRAPSLDAADDLQGLPSAPAGADERLQVDLGECVALFVSQLPSPYREAIILTELEGLTQKEAADMLGVSLSALKSRVQRGRDRIRHLFDECCHISVDGRGRVIECEPRDLEQVPPGCRAAVTPGKS